MLIKTENPEDEQVIGTLYRKGFMIERYDNRVDDLVRSFTKKGVDQIKEILKDPKYKKIFAQILYKETIGMSNNDKIGVIMEIKKMLEHEQGRTATRGTK
jgi:hypothetical protein